MERKVVEVDGERFVEIEDGKLIPFDDLMPGDQAELIAAVWLLKHGYYVYRNVSSQGAADLVAIHHRSGEMMAIDVKRSRQRRTEKHRKFRVRMLAVYPNGEAAFEDLEPELSGPVADDGCEAAPGSAAVARCKRCNAPFVGDGAGEFCCWSCSDEHYHEVVEFVCERCGRTFKAKRRTGTRRFCGPCRNRPDRL